MSGSFKLTNGKKKSLHCCKELKLYADFTRPVKLDNIFDEIIYLINVIHYESTKLI